MSATGFSSDRSTSFHPMPIGKPRLRPWHQLQKSCQLTTECSRWLLWDLVQRCSDLAHNFLTCRRVSKAFTGIFVTSPDLEDRNLTVFAVCAAKTVRLFQRRVVVR